MPFLPIIVLFATGLTLLAAGSPLGGIFLVLATIAVSLKLGMPVVKHPTHLTGPLHAEAGKSKALFLDDRTC